MIILERILVEGWDAAIRGMRNPYNSWENSDSVHNIEFNTDEEQNPILGSARRVTRIGEKDLALMKSLVKAGSDHSKFLRMITVTIDITAPLYWWKEFDTYKVGTVANSCSTMHTLQNKEFTLDDFSHEFLWDGITEVENESGEIEPEANYLNGLETTIELLNLARDKFNETHNKKYWWQMIQLLPSSYNQKRTVQLNYQVLKSMYNARRTHKLDEWVFFCNAIAENFPYFKEICIDK